VTVDEMKAFVGMLMLMGIYRLPQLEMYWSTKHPLINPGLADVFPLVRFQQIFRFIHLNDSDQQVGVDQPGYVLFKVRKFLDLITPLFETEYNTQENVSIDEAMIPFKGRLRFKQYMKDKPTKWGIKVFVLADSTNGYVSRIQVYTGKNSSLSRDEVGLSSRVVLELLDGLEGRHPKVYMDNFYSSPALFLTLYRKGVNACGTVRPNRKYFPQELNVNKRDVDTGYYDYRSSGPLLASVWMDKRILHLLSTMSNGPNYMKLECTSCHSAIPTSCYTYDKYNDNTHAFSK